MTGRRGHGEGSIYKRSDGRWAATIDLGWNEGKRKRKTVYGKTRRDVAQQLTKLQHDAARGLAIIDDKRLLGDFLDSWLSDVVKPTTRIRTHEAAESIVRTHIKPTLGQRPIGKLRAPQIQRLLAEKTSQGLRPRTVELIWSTLRRALRVAVKQGVIVVNPADAVTPPRPVRKDVDVFNLDEVRKLLAMARDEHHGVAFTLALTTGMRRGELLGLKWANVDLDAGTLRVTASLQRIGSRLVEGEPKSDKSRRTIRLPRTTVEALRVHRASQAKCRLRAGERWRDTDYVVSTDLGGPVEPTNLLRDWKLLLDRAGIDRRALHVARHSAASLLLSEGVPLKTVQEVLGHSTIRLTADTYGHLMPGDDERAADAMDRAVG